MRSTLDRLDLASDEVNVLSRQFDIRSSCADRRVWGKFMSHLHDRMNRKSMPMKPSLDNAYAVPGLLKPQHIEIIIIQTETVFFFPSGYRPFLADFGRPSEGLQGLSTVGGTTENILYGVANLHALTDTARHDFVFIKPKKDSRDTKKTLTKQLP